MEKRHSNLCRNFNYIKEKKEISPNSVRTLLTRLVKKKAILVSGKVGKSYTYEALLTKEEFLRTETEHFLNTLCDGSAVPLILSYFKQGLITKEYLIELYNSIDEE